MAKHSTYSASAAHRWVPCPGSLKLEQEGIEQGLLPKSRPSSPAAEEGTMLHDVTERCLRNDTDADTVQHLTDEQKEAVQFCLDVTRAIPGDIRMYEMRSTYGKALGLPGNKAFGTADVVILDGTTLHVADHKFGRRFVEPEGNLQMELYALGVLSAVEALGEEVETIQMHVLQPRVSGDQPSYVIGRNELDADKFIKAANQAEKGKPLNPGKVQCQWCPAKAICPKMEEMAKEANREAASMDEFDDDDDLSNILDNADLIRNYLDAVEEEAKRRLAQGKQVEGYKLIEGRKGNRKWEGENIEEFLSGHKITPVKKVTLTPSQAQTELAKIMDGKTAKERKEQAGEIIDQRTVRKEGKPKLVPVSEGGTPWHSGASLDEF